MCLSVKRWHRCDDGFREDSTKRWSMMVARYGIPAYVAGMGCKRPSFLKACTTAFLSLEWCSSVFSKSSLALETFLGVFARDWSVVAKSGILPCIQGYFCDLTIFLPRKEMVATAGLK
jgi:hypothetical protein